LKTIRAIILERGKPSWAEEKKMIVKAFLLERIASVGGYSNGSRAGVFIRRDLDGEQENLDGLFKRENVKVKVHGERKKKGQFFGPARRGGAEIIPWSEISGKRVWLEEKDDTRETGEQLRNYQRLEREEKLAVWHSMPIEKGGGRFC